MTKRQSSKFFNKFPKFYSNCQNCHDTIVICHWGFEILYKAMSRENRLLVTDEPVEFEELSVDVQDFKKNTIHFRGICGIYPQINEEKLKEVNM